MQLWASGKEIAGRRWSIGILVVSIRQNYPNQFCFLQFLLAKVLLFLSFITALWLKKLSDWLAVDKHHLNKNIFFLFLLLRIATHDTKKGFDDKNFFDVKLLFSLFAWFRCAFRPTCAAVIGWLLISTIGTKTIFSCLCCCRLLQKMFWRQTICWRQTIYWRQKVFLAPNNLLAPKNVLAPRNNLEPKLFFFNLAPIKNVLASIKTFLAPTKCFGAKTVLASINLFTGYR